ncbi:MAG: VCBS repeat-containing protein [Planctomycetota bacterium]|nr:VCBS repeat-containing protein [Planctomycetota bacterium]
MKRLPAIVLVAALAAACTLPVRAEVRFRKTVLDKTFRSEGAAAGDVNHDGKMDVLAGDVWYAAPKWTMHEVRKVGTYSPDKGYSQCFQNFSADVNGDGWIDSVIVNWPGKQCNWYENPQNKAGHWPEHPVTSSAGNETSIFADLLGTGRQVLLAGFVPDRVMAWWTPPKDPAKPWDMHALSVKGAPGTQQYSHGLGIGDVNGDGRSDVVITAGWWEAPQDRSKTPWTFHKADLGPKCADMIVYDVDGDGDNDIITTSAHAYGMWMHEQVKTGDAISFRRHEFFKAFSQTHAVRLVDVNGDGLMDLVTGKRYHAHNGHDPGGNEPALLYWFELKRPAKGKWQYVPHQIDGDSGIGTQFTVCDMNGDSKPDIVASNKKGVHVFVQQ